MKKIIVFLFFSIFILFTCGEGRKGAKGAFDNVFVISNQEMQDTMKSTVDSCFIYGIRTPALQQYFQVGWVGMQKFDVYSEYKNVIFLANLDQEGQDQKYAKAILPDKQYQLAAKDSTYIFSIKNPFALNQTMIVIAGKNIERMKNHIRQQKDWIYNKFNKRYVNRIKNYIFGKEKDNKIINRLWDKYHWTFRALDGYKVIEEQDNFIWLGRMHPFRWISFSWEAGKKPKLFTKEGLLTKRQEIGAKYDSVGTDTSALGSHYTNFKNYESLKLYGLWYHKNQTKGGPFATYSFYDKKTNRTFVVDFLLYNPGERSTNIFRRMEILVQTFTTEYKKKGFVK